VIDAKTGQGVAGAEVFRSYGATDALAFFGEPGSRNQTPDWVTTGPDGGFSFRGRWLWWGGLYVLDSTPYIEWVHPEYGFGGFSKRKIEDYQRIIIKIERDERHIQHMRDWRANSGGSYPCSLSSREANERCRVVAYGDAGRGPP
jgi:hypothetical protein